MAKAPVSKNCAATHCLCTDPLVREGEGVCERGRWFHTICYKAREAQKEAVDIYYQQISRTVVMKQLQRTINNLLYEKRCDPDLLVFALKYAVKNNYTVKSPYSLQYLVNDYRIKEAYERYLKRKQAVQKIVGNIVYEEAETPFTVASPTKGGFDKILN